MFPVLRASRPTQADLYFEHDAYEGALIQIEAPRVFGYIAHGTLEAGSGPSRRLMAQYVAAGMHVDVHFAGAATWWNASGEEDWEDEAGDGMPSTFPDSLLAFL
jgi:hypothetical protein